MENYTAISQFLYESRPNKEAIDHLMNSLLSDKNIIDVTTDEESISIEYYQQLICYESLQLLIETFGIELSIKQNKKELIYERNPIKRFLNKMAKSNEKNFGNKRLDCCKLNE